MDQYSRTKSARDTINIIGNQNYNTQKILLLKEIAVNSGIIADALKQLVNITYKEKHL